MWPLLLERSAEINLAVSGTLFLIGLIIYYASTPEILSKHKFSQWVFGFWTAQWAVFVAIYIVVIRYPEQEVLLLTFVDLQTMLVLASAWGLLEGKDLNIKGTLIFLGALFAVLIAWNSLLNPSDIVGGSPDHRFAWVSFSETLSSLSMPLLGLAFFIRYQVYGFPFLFFSVFYGACQRAIYSAAFITSQDVSQSLSEIGTLFLSVAFGKAILGGLFYGLFYFTLPDYPSLVPPLSEEVARAIRGKMRQALTWALGSVLIPILVALLTALATSWLEK